MSINNDIEWDNIKVEEGPRDEQVDYAEFQRLLQGV